MKERIVMLVLGNQMFDIVGEVTHESEDHIFTIRKPRFMIWRQSAPPGEPPTLELSEMRFDPPVACFRPIVWLDVTDQKLVSAYKQIVSGIVIANSLPQ